MNPSTGQVKEFESAFEAQSEGFTELLEKAPEPSCKKCKGRGSVPAGIGSRKFKPCKCTYTVTEGVIR